MQTLPVGYLSLPADALTQATVVRQAGQELTGDINQARSGAGLSALE
jgi:hypothetical protein